MIIDYLNIIWITFLIGWVFMLIVRMRLNHIIYKKQQQQIKHPVPPKNPVALFFIYMFTLYNKPSKFEETGFRRLKIWTNALHQFYIYSFIFMLIFSFIGFIQYDVHTHARERRDKQKKTFTNCIEDTEPRFGPDYNTTRKKNKLIPLPDDFCMSSSNENTEIWEPVASPDENYFYQIKTVYIEDGEWEGEYDIFIHREPDVPDEILTAEFHDLDGSMDVLYLYNDEGISERKFVEIIRKWGLEDKLGWEPANM